MEAWAVGISTHGIYSICSREITGFGLALPWDLGITICIYVPCLCSLVARPLGRHVQ